MNFLDSRASASACSSAFGTSKAPSSLNTMTIAVG